MDKLKRSRGLKCAAAIMFSVSLFAFVLSGIFAVALLDFGAYGDGVSDEIYDSCMENITHLYINDAMQYYDRMLSDTVIIRNGLEEYNHEDYYTDYDFAQSFSKNQTNLSFKIKPVDNENYYPTLYNYLYEGDEAALSGTEYCSARVSMNLEFSYSLPVKKLNSDGYVTDELYYSFSEDDLSELDYYLIEAEDDYGYEDGIVKTEVQSASSDIDDIFSNTLLSNSYIDYKLSDDKELMSEWNNFLLNLDDLYIDSYYMEYDSGTGVLSVFLGVIGDEIPITVDWSLPAAFTAHDYYYDSFVLNHFEYVQFAVDACIPVLVISFILIVLLGIYLVMAAGHRRGTNEIILSRFDKIPYDIILIGAFLVVVYMFSVDVCFLGDYSRVFAYIVTLVTVLLTCALMTAIIMTTAVRFKADCSILKNTVTVRLVKLLWKALRYIINSITASIKYLVCHMNLYLKYLAVMAVMAVIGLVAAGTGSISAVLFAGFIDFAVIFCVLVRALKDMAA